MRTSYWTLIRRQKARWLLARLLLLNPVLAFTVVLGDRQSVVEPLSVEVARKILTAELLVTKLALPNHIVHVLVGV